VDRKGSILIVDDDDSTCRSLTLVLGRKSYDAETVGTGREAMEKAQGRSFNLVLLDIKLPDVEGIELLAPLKEMHPDMGVIMVTGYASLDTAVRALNEGASAYIMKPFNMDVVLASVNKTIEEQRLAMESKRLYQAAQRELAERERTQEELLHLAMRDPLTGLPNRAHFNERLALALAHAQRSRERLPLMLLDLDHFKQVNDTLGHNVGDRLLQHVAQRLRSLLRRSDTVARMGGDEFLLLLPGITQVEQVTKVARRVLEAVRKPLALDSHQLSITTSIGIAIYPGDGDDADTLIRNADIAMYRAKERGRDDYQYYDSKGKE